jgi:OOP family OmpA-OmpF porin
MLKRCVETICGFELLLCVAVFPANAQAAGNSSPVIPQGWSREMFYSGLPPPPADAEYLVFFDWNKYSLRSKSLSIIAIAAQDDKRLSFCRIYISGFADTSGSPSYNQELSLKRALVVRDQLVADGVSKTKIVLKYYGSTSLLVPSGPNVRIDDNRRVEIQGDKPRSE